MANKTLNTKNLKASLTLEKDLTSKTTVKEIKGVSEIKTAAGSRVQKEQLLDFTEKTGVSILELRADSASRTLDDVRTELDEIIRSKGRFVDDDVRFNEGRAKREMQELLENFERYGTSGFTAKVYPAGGVICEYIRPWKQTTGPYTYSLLRKKEALSIVAVRGNKQQTTAKNGSSSITSKLKTLEWEILVPTRLSYPVLGLVLHDDTAEEGCKYTYRLVLNYTDTNKTESFEATVLYEKLKLNVVEFSARADSINKKVVVTCNVQNASTIKVYRKDTGKVLSSPYVDTNVELNKAYEYVLEAANKWEFVKKTAKVSCSNLKPTMGKITATIETFDRGVTLQWPSVANISHYTVERSLSGKDSWTMLSSATSQSSYKDIDESENEKVLQKEKTYVYRVVAHNGWGDSTAATVSVKMTNAAPKTPRILYPGSNTLCWTAIDNAKEYRIERTDNPSGHNWTQKRGYTSITDGSATVGKLYTYTIQACNGWGKSGLCYCDAVKQKTETKGEIRDIYYYLGQNENSKDCVYEKWMLNFQGIATDGKWWYITNGTPGWTTSIRKASVDKTLSRSINNDYPVPDADHAHVGDLECYKGYLFVPVYKTDGDDYIENGKIWIFKADKDSDKVKSSDRLATIEIYKDSSHTPFQSIGWCAINPCDDRLYLADGSLGPSSPLYSLKVHFDKIKEQKWGEVFDDPRRVFLYDEKGNIITKESMQGGCFDYYNNIYLNSGSQSGSRTGQGVHVFKLIRDDSMQLRQKLLAAQNDDERAKIYEAYKSGDLKLPFDCTKGLLIAQSRQDYGFRYQFNPGKEQEPEGLVYYDFTYAERTPKQDYIGSTSLHVGLLMNDSSGYIRERVNLKHYVHKLRDTEERNVYYNPSNLKVISAVECNDDGVNETVYKVVDNGILVKKFKQKKYANAALSVLKNFDRIHTTGWLYTSSSKHNYEFSALEGRVSETISGRNVVYYTVLPKGDETEQVEKEFWKVEIRASNGDVYHFRAHNKADADAIREILNRHATLCYVGEGPDTYERTKGCFRSANNLIWLE